MDYFPDDEPGTNELRLLFEVCARTLTKSPEPAEFLNWIADAGPVLAPDMAAQIDPRTGPTGQFFRTLGVAIYNAMPQPAHGFRPRKLPVPGRNDPCRCGSGIKYKRCCLPLGSDLDFEEYNLLRHVLDNIPQQHFRTLPESQADILAGADTARQWDEEGATTRAVALLEPWFAGSRKLTGKLEYAFDQLMDCYFELGNPGKRRRLIAQVLERGDDVLRSAALQRHCLILADEGNLTEAWETFEDARRADPDSLSLVPLELTLLMSNGEIEQARERARFWLARLERMNDPNLEPLKDLVRKFRDDPQAAITDMDGIGLPGLTKLEALFEEAPVIETHYTIIEVGDGERMLEPDAALQALERRWFECFPQDKPPLTTVQIADYEMWDEPERWLHFLTGNPLAWQSFNVLDDLVLAVAAVPVLGVGASLLERLISRAVALLDANLKTAESESNLSWVCTDNRPVLRLLAHGAFLALEDPARGKTSDDFIQRAERLLALNPIDNHGIRDPLSSAYLARDWPDKALSLTDRYPDDFCGPALNRILALLRVGREADALDALTAAREYHDVAIKMLLADKPRTPKTDDGFGIRIGGKQEAWIYRTAMRAEWERDGGLDWLKKASRKRRRRS